jgi:hypothetical protein
MGPVSDILFFVVLPLWVTAGLADYLCHRAGAIEAHNGVRENLLHWLMMAELGVPLALALFFRVNALLLGVMALALVAHEITTHADLRLASRTRIVTPFEQMVHSFLEMMPFAAFLLVAILRWPQAQALLGAGSEPADFSLIFQPLPAKAIIAVLGGMALLNGLPYLDETRRGLKAEKRPAPSAGRP